MVLSDFLSRQQGDDSDSHQIIPILFNMKEILKQNSLNVVQDTFVVQSRSQIKSKGVKAPTVQGATKLSDKTKRKETKPTVIQDTSIIIDLDTKSDIDTQLQVAAVTQTQPYDPTKPGVRQTSTYFHLYQGKSGYAVASVAKNS